MQTKLDMSEPAPSLDPMEPSPREPARKVSALRRFYWLEEELAAAKRNSFGKSDPGFYEYERALEADEACAAILAPREPLRRSDGSRAASTLAREAATFAAKAHLLRAGRNASTSVQAIWEAFLGLPVAASLERSLGADFARAVGLVTADPLVPSAADPATAKADLAALRKLVAALVTPLDEASRLADAVRLRRVLRIGTTLALLVGVVVGAVFAVGVWMRGPNLALHKETSSSSTYRDQKSTKGAVDGIRKIHGFHTSEEENPWLTIDLGAAQTVGSVVVYNRADCCEDRAVPLVVETSLDGQQWTQVARRNKVFDRWKTSFPPTEARYVRLTAQKKTYLHLNEIEIYRR